MLGLLISFEGGEGVGKGTQVRLLKEKLEAMERNVLLTREPGGTPMAEEIRHLLKHHPEGKELTAVAEAEALLFMSARVLNTVEVITPALAAGKIILCDRYIDSSVVYQGMVRGLGIDRIDWLNNFATRGRKPDITILLDMPVEAALKRVAQRHLEFAAAESDRFDEEKNSFHENIRKAYLALAKKEPRRIVVVDASPTDPQIIAKEIWKHVESRLA